MEATERDLLLQFFWTRDETDAIGTPAKLKDWLVGLGLLGAEEVVTDDDVRLARHFRAAALGLCATHSGYPSDPRSAATIDELNAKAPLKVTVGPYGRLDVEPGGTGVAKALSSLLAIGYKATVAGEFVRFKACKGCGWAFFDESKNGSKIWCDMGSCGTRAKMKAYRARKKSENPS